MPESLLEFISIKFYDKHKNIFYEMHNGCGNKASCIVLLRKLSVYDLCEDEYIKFIQVARFNVP